MKEETKHDPELLQCVLCDHWFSSLVLLTLAVRLNIHRLARKTIIINCIFLYLESSEWKHRRLAERQYKNCTESMPRPHVPYKYTYNRLITLSAHLVNLLAQRSSPVVLRSTDLLTRKDTCRRVELFLHVRLVHLFTHCGLDKLGS